MWKITCIISLLATLVVGSAIVSRAQIKGTSKSKPRRVAAKEQTVFGAEADVKHKVNIPKDVLEQLGEYDNRRLEQCQQDDWRESKITNHFAATKLSLNGDNLSDMVVQAQTLCFMGAHNTTFWIFTDVGQRLSPGYELVFDQPADFLEVLRTTTNGYRDIETGSHTAVEMYTTRWKFDGQKYQPRECKIENFTTKRISRIKCDF